MTTLFQAENRQGFLVNIDLEQSFNQQNVKQNQYEIKQRSLARIKKKYRANFRA